MLSKIGVKCAKKMCAKNDDLSHEMISPINGSFDHFPKTILFLATNDITYPDQKLFTQKLKKANVNIEVIIGENMPHIWPFLPVIKEAKAALKVILNNLKS
ncbi:alpha/beta hydrolase [uncultured Arcticibacterium sp.]|uniref:alpha/beta hydrolase n=1 Tax=uncultured Arcticibacterium sp. TaxID=2173042 RepID=UPI0030F82817